MVSSQVSLDSPVPWKQHSGQQTKNANCWEACECWWAGTRWLSCTLSSSKSSAKFCSSTWPHKKIRASSISFWNTDISFHWKPDQRRKRFLWSWFQYAFPWISFCSILPGRVGKYKGVGEDIWGVSTPHCCHLLFGVQSKPGPVEGQPRNHNSPAQSLGCHLGELVADRWGIMTATKPQPSTGRLTQQVQRNGRTTIEKHRKIAIHCTTSARHCHGQGHNYCLSGVSTEQVGNGTSTVQIAGSTAFLPLLMYTQAQNARKYLIIIIISFQEVFHRRHPRPCQTKCADTSLSKSDTGSVSLSTGNYTPPFQKQLINASGGGDCCLLCFLSPTYPSCRMPAVKSSQLDFKPAVRALKG